MAEVDAGLVGFAAKQQAPQAPATRRGADDHHPQRHDDGQRRPDDRGERPQHRPDERAADRASARCPGVHLQRATEQRQVGCRLLVGQRRRLGVSQEPTSDGDRRRLVASLDRDDPRRTTGGRVQVAQRRRQRSGCRPHREPTSHHTPPANMARGDVPSNTITAHPRSSPMARKRDGRSNLVSRTIHHMPRRTSRRPAPTRVDQCRRRTPSRKSDSRPKTSTPTTTATEKHDHEPGLAALSRRARPRHASASPRGRGSSSRARTTARSFETIGSSRGAAPTRSGRRTGRRARSRTGRMAIGRMLSRRVAVVSRTTSGRIAVGTGLAVATIVPMMP